MKNFDVVIVGGGPAGAATALALSERGLSAVVIERSDYSHQRIGETLPPAIHKLLVRLGLSDRFRAANHSPSFGIRAVWGRAEAHENNFILNPYGSGWHVDRARFDSLLAQAADDSGARVVRGAKLLSCVEESGGWQCELSQGEQRQRIRAKLLVDATGRRALVARRYGARRTLYDHLLGVVGFFSPRLGHQTTDSFTLVEAVEEGWWYSARLPDSRVVAVYMTDADLYARARKGSANHWVRQLRKAAHTHLRVKSFSTACAPFVVAAHSSRLDPAAGGNWLAVGDAAATFDPLSSHGVYHALACALRAAESIEAHLAGDRAALTRYVLEVREGFDKFLRLRRAYYGREQRWPNFVFWQRRRSAPPAAG